MFVLSSDLFIREQARDNIWSMDVCAIKGGIKVKEEDDNLASANLALPDFEAELRNNPSNRVDTKADESCRNSIVLAGDKSEAQKITEKIIPPRPTTCSLERDRKHRC